MFDAWHAQLKHCLDNVAPGTNNLWLRAKADDITYCISEGVSGFLLQELVLASEHCDVEVAELFREGGCAFPNGMRSNCYLITRHRCSNVGPACL